MNPVVEPHVLNDLEATPETFLDVLLGSDPATLSPELLRVRGQFLKFRKRQEIRSAKRIARIEAAKIPMGENRHTKRRASAVKAKDARMLARAEFVFLSHARAAGLMAAPKAQLRSMASKLQRKGVLNKEQGTALRGSWAE